KAVGTELAKNDSIVIISGGSYRRTGASTNDLATDWHIVNAAALAIRDRWGEDAVDQRIETVIPRDVDASSTPAHQHDADEPFRIGTLKRARGKTREARRFSFVRSLDGLFAVAGRGGTAQEMALAIELETPVYS